ncbi:MAG: hypothetical protein IJM71_09010 [Clostridia bacterium]|nr:hypothetical protein [Clostridia bacterium]
MMIFEKPQTSSGSPSERIFDLYAYLRRLHEQLQTAEEMRDKEMRDLKEKIEKLEGKDGK